MNIDKRSQIEEQRSAVQYADSLQAAIAAQREREREEERRDCFRLVYDMVNRKCGTNTAVILYMRDLQTYMHNGVGISVASSSFAAAALACLLNPHKLAWPNNPISCWPVWLTVCRGH